MRARRIVTILVCLVPAWGCATARWASPIGDFKQSVDATVTVVETYYRDLNAYERRLYLEGVYFNPQEEVLFTDALGKPTPMAGRVFSAASIKARIDALSLVSTYARRLADLAGSQAPTKFAENADLLGASLGGLSQTFEGLSGTDASAAAYVGPVASLIGVIGRVVLEQRRDAAITLAIEQGDGPVTKILDLVEQDLAAVIAPLRTTGEKLLLAELVSDYNANRTTVSPDERRRRIDRIAAASDAYFEVLASNPAGLIGGLRDAHHSMVKYASSPRKPADLGEFAAELELFANRVAVAAASVRALRDAN